MVTKAYQQAARDYVEAVQLDPNFRFRVGTTRRPSQLSLLQTQLNLNTKHCGGAVKEAADRASALAPEAGESWIAQGAYRYRVLRDFAGAVTAYEASANHDCRIIPICCKDLAFVQTPPLVFGRKPKATI